jgi:hypothetical protein
MGLRGRGVLFVITAAAVFAGAIGFTRSARGDEGMWLLNALPAERLKSKHGFTPDEAWTRHVMQSCVRFAGTGGASGSLVSRDGLVLTNHHVALSHLQHVSTAEHDYVRDGFIAKTREQELRAPGLEADVLTSIEDVTDRVTAAVRPEMGGEEADKARKAAVAAIERESKQATGLRSDVVTLYGGYRFHLYRYKVYDDVRIVFAPEYGVGFFGGDPDNFEYPRYCLDMTLMRVYDEHGKPARVEHYFKWSNEGVRDGEPVFVAGHPRRTERLLTTSALKRRQDVVLPFMLRAGIGRERALLDYSSEGPEQARQATQNLFGTQNRLKVLRGQTAGLTGGSILADKLEFERKLRERVAARPELAKTADVWDRVAVAEHELAALHPRLELFEDGYAFWSALFERARTLVRLADEDAKPDGQRLPEFTQAKRAELERELFAAEPVYPALEIRRLTSSLTLMRDQLGDADPLAKQVLAGKSPAARAAELVKGSKLASPDERRRLKAGGRAAIDASDDALIRLAAMIDPESRRLRAARDAKADEPLLRAYADLSRILFTLDGADRYPDATGTLRLSFGDVRGYEEAETEPAPWTTIGQAFDHAAAHENVDPWKLPDAWHAARPRLAADTPFNFVSTADITGGNSGSPTFNRAGELVGLVFDGNRHSLTDGYGYSERRRRSVHVDARGMRELLGKVYGADALLAEIGGRDRTGATDDSAR